MKEKMYTTKEEIEKEFSITYLSELEFSTEKILNKVEKRCHRKLKSEKHKKLNRWVNGLYKNDLERKKESEFHIKRVSALVGYGVYSTKRIPELTYIGEYTGVVKRRERRKDRYNDYIFGYIVGPSDTPWVIDASKKGNFTRFINHSFSPNLTSRWIIHENVCHVILFANRLILPGEQLTYDYGPYYWKRRSFPLDL